MIEFKDVSKVYPNGTVALEHVNLTIDDGEFVFVVGASGAGKSTLMKLLLREEKVTSGKLIVGDYDLTKIPNYKIPYYRRQLGMVFQDFRLFEKKQCTKMSRLPCVSSVNPQGRSSAACRRFFPL